MHAKAGSRRRLDGAGAGCHDRFLVVYRVARLKVLEESLDGNTRATEHRRASHNLGRNRNQVVAHIRKRIGKGLLRQAWRLTACG